MTYEEKIAAERQGLARFRRKMGAAFIGTMSVGSIGNLIGVSDKHALFLFAMIAGALLGWGLMALWCRNEAAIFLWRFNRAARRGRR